MAPGEISVVIPTYRRPRALKNCLEALRAQTRQPYAVIVVVRPEDSDSHGVVQAFEQLIPVQLALVERPGQVQALNRGLTFVSTPLLAITDDDARPCPQWLERIVTHFNDPRVGAVGGRDVVYWEGELLDGSAKLVGRVQWYGRVIGNHHLRAPLQDVQFLKGANMSYRRDALLGFDEHLAGGGSQICNDMQASLRVHASGWRVVWDPAVAVDHFPEERLDEDKRIDPTLRAVANQLHNQTYILLSLLSGWRRVTAFAFTILIGSQFAPGLIMLPVTVLRSRSTRRSWFGFRANVQGRLRGLVTFIRTSGRPRIPADVVVTSEHRAPA